MLGNVVGDKFVGACLDCGRARRKALDLVVADAGKLHASVASRAACSQLETEGFEFICEYTVVHRGGVHGGLVEAARVDGQPPCCAVLFGDLYPVGDHDVVVKLGIAFSGFPVAEAGADEPGGFV